MDRILTDVEYRMYIDDGTDEGSDRWDNVMELRRLAAEYKDRSLTDFLEDIALVSDQDTLQSEAQCAHPAHPACCQGAGVRHRLHRRPERWHAAALPLLR